MLHARVTQVKQFSPRRRRPRHAGRTSRGPLLAVFGVFGMILLAQFAFKRDSPAIRSDQTLLTSRKTDGAAILRQLADRYAELSHYEDRTRMRIRHPAGNQWLEEGADLHVRFSRPNQLRLEVQLRDGELLMASNGSFFTTRIIDPATGDFDNQFLRRAAPDELSVAAIYAAAEYADPSHPGELFSALMSLPAPLPISQLAPLLDQQSIDTLIASAQSVERLESQAIAGNRCACVRVAIESGDFVFWIDEKSGLVRRLEFPTPTPGDKDDNAILVSDYTDIHVQKRFTNESFEIPTPADAKVVRNFVLPPSEFVAPVLGETVDRFAFTEVTSNSVRAWEPDGRLTVLVWFNHHPASRAVVEQIDQAYRNHAGTDVRFLAVCTEPSTSMSHAEVRGLVRNWNLQLPVARDLAAVGRDVFGVQQAPTLVIIDPREVVQLYEVGGSPDLNKKLGVVIERLEKGEDLAAEYIQHVQRRQQDYSAALVAAGSEVPADRFSLPRSTTTPQPRPPHWIQLEEAWRIPVRSGGGITLVREGILHTLLVQSDTDQVLELDSGGRTRRQHRLAVDTPAYHTIRNAMGRYGERMFIGLSAGDPRITLFDQNFDRRFDYPPIAESPVEDAQLADLEEDGELELYIAIGGPNSIVDRVNLDGRPQWTRDDVGDVLSFAISNDSSGRQYLLATTREGMIIPIAADGSLHEPLQVPARTIHHLFAIDDPNGTFCAWPTQWMARHWCWGWTKRCKRPGIFRLATGPALSIPWSRALHGITAALFTGCWPNRMEPSTSFRKTGIIATWSRPDCPWPV